MTERARRVPPYLGAQPGGPDAAGSGAARVRPYQLTGGRTTPADPTLALEAQVVASAEGCPDGLSYEHRELVSAAHAPVSVAELGAALKLHLQVVRVLVADLTAAGHLTVLSPGGAGSDPAVIERVIRGLTALR